jgi:flavin-dependent dehydrogenase
MKPEIWKAQLEKARTSFHPLVFGLLGKIEEPFVSVIASITPKQATFFDGRLFFIGDALATIQPNTGSGTNNAAFAAMKVADVIQGKMKAAEFNEQMVYMGEEQKWRAKLFGPWYLDNWLVVLYYGIMYKLCPFKRSLKRLLGAQL